VTDPVSPAPVDLVLFDLVGVLVKGPGVAALRELAGLESDAEVWTRWLASPWARRFESGNCPAEDFAAGIVDEMELAIGPDEFLAEFRSWQPVTLEGAETLVADVAQRTTVGCLSNTNPVQWADYAGAPLIDLFNEELRFLSFELGTLKPDRAVFDLVAARLPAPRQRVLFLDDNAPNVEGARDAGYLAEQVDGVAGARQALERWGVL
jgi:putative hydrolase of the HAD superfamily